MLGTVIGIITAIAAGMLLEAIDRDHTKKEEVSAK